jgi:hypothetical protein
MNTTWIHDTREHLIIRIIDSATRINDTDSLRRFTRSVVKHAQIYTEAEIGHYSSETPGYVKSCTTTVISCYNKRVCRTEINVTFPTPALL